MKALSRITKFLFAYIAICGLVVFPLFLFEESIQMATFGTWPASDAKDWELVITGIKTIERINTTMKIVNYSLGWIQPLSFFSYRAYAIATDYYISGMKAKIFAHEPGALVGQEVVVSVKLTGTRVQVMDDRHLYLTNRVTYSFPRPITGPSVKIRGIISQSGDRVIFTVTEILS